MDVGDALVPIAVALIAATPGYLLHRRSRKVDAETAKAKEETARAEAHASASAETRAERALVLDHLYKIIDNLKVDKKEDREEIRVLEAQLATCHRRVQHLLYGDDDEPRPPRVLP